MDNPLTNRAIACFAVGLCAVGALALCGLAAPLASGYLWPDETAGGSAITRTSSPLVKVHFIEAGRHSHPAIAGRLLPLWPAPDMRAPTPPCPAEPGRA